jgi:hypothetical protein
MAETGGYKVILASNASSFTEVRLHDETLYEHIPEHHSEIKLAGTALGAVLIAEAITEAVTKPSKIHQSTTSEGSQVFTCNRVTHQGNPIVVPVKKMGDLETGKVVTAYFSSNDYPGTLVWSDDDE